MLALLGFILALLTSPFKSRSRLEAENAALRQQLIVLRRQVGNRVRFTNSDLYPAVSVVSLDPEGHRHHESRDAPAVAPGWISPITFSTASTRSGSRISLVRPLIDRHAAGLDGGSPFLDLAAHELSEMLWGHALRRDEGPTESFHTLAYG